jgi:hypothetical protein
LVLLFYSQTGSSLFGQKPAFTGLGSSLSQSTTSLGSSFQQTQPAFGSTVFGSTPEIGTSSTPAFGTSSTLAFGSTSVSLSGMYYYCFAISSTLHKLARLCINTIVLDNWVELFIGMFWKFNLIDYYYLFCLFDRQQHGSFWCPKHSFLWCILLCGFQCIEHAGFWFIQYTGYSKRPA